MNFYLAAAFTTQEPADSDKYMYKQATDNCACMQKRILGPDIYKMQADKQICKLTRRHADRAMRTQP
jgi:hypothetical protein